MGAGLVSAQNIMDAIGPTVLVAPRDGQQIYVCEALGKQIAILNASDLKIVGRIGLPEKPTGLALSIDGSRLFIPTESQNGLVLVIRTDNFSIESKMYAGHTPNAPVLGIDGKSLYVCNRFNHTVSKLDIASGRELAKFPVRCEPVSATITPNGKNLVVANLRPDQVSTADYVGASLCVINLKSGMPELIPLPNGSSSVRGVCVSPDGHFAYAVHILSHYQLPSTQVEYGWMNTAALSVIDLMSGKLLNTVVLDDPEEGAANPWSVGCSQDGRYLCISHAGTHELSVIDRPALHEKLERIQQDKVHQLAVRNVSEDFNFLRGIRRRIKLAGKGPRGLLLIGHKAYMAEYFSDTVGEVDILPDASTQPISAALGPKQPMSIERKGEMLFHDATSCLQHWQSCSSCHPDGRSDGLNWDLLNDGIGNPKNTKSLLFAHRTSPAMWLGVRETAEQAVRAGFQFIEFRETSEENATAVDAYLKSLRPVSSPYLIHGNLAKAALRGKKIFDEAECIECHAPPIFGGHGFAEIGTGGGMDKGKSFTIPSLSEVWRTAPYLHDGSAETIQEVLTTRNIKGRHGKVSRLSRQEIDDLCAYVLSL